MPDEQINAEEHMGIELIMQFPWPINCWDILHVPLVEDPDVCFKGKTDDSIFYIFKVRVPTSFLLLLKR